MIIGIGSDIVDMRRIGRLLERHGERFLRRVYAPRERQAAMALADPVPYLARRFAAKEAMAKALGTGFGRDVSWVDICILNNERGAPEAELCGGAARRLEALTAAGGRARVHVSLSDEPPLALAFVVIEA
jgi:holo-[acyl-carrier protein] synthase